MIVGIRTQKSNCGFISQVKDIDSEEKYACLGCWSKVESFNEFYTMVAANYQNNANVIDGAAFINPLLDCELETTANDTVIKVEPDQFDSCESNYEAVYIPSTFDWDDSNKQMNEDTSEALKENSNPFEVKTTNQRQESVCLLLEKAEESEPKYRPASASKKKKTIRTKPDSSEWKPKEQNCPKDAIITIDGVM